MSKRQLKQLWTFFVVGIKTQLRNPSALFFGFIVPLIFLISFSFFGNDSSVIKIGLVANDDPEYVTFKQVLDQSQLVEVQESSLSNLQPLLEKGSLDAILEFKAAPSSRIVTINSKTKEKVFVPGEVLSYVNNNKPVRSQIANQAIGTIIDHYSLKANKLGPVYNLSAQEINGSQGKYIDYVLPGLIGFSLLGSTIMSTTFSFITLRKTQTLKRLFATPASPSMYIVGISLSRVVFGFIQSLIVLLVAMFAFGYAPRYGIASLPEISAILLIGIFMFLGLGYIVAGVAKNEDQASPLANLLTLPQFLLAGTFFSVEILPPWLRFITTALPLYRFSEAMRLISIDGLHIWSAPVLTQIGIMVAWIIAIYTLAARVFRIRD